ncbi:hypothetical protein Taro_015857 [Colocasia esculenta]|uniref:Uncharacterized protein n=1 Tax=Colocasia esculenta TaxID=4460 RepID=A0A843UNH2_COLES|nr:hypothetical protein [Colocasia esculenta]
MDTWGYKYPCLWYSKGIPRKIRPRAFWKREGEREKGICIQRSRAAPPREEEGEEGEEEGEEEKGLVIAAVLIQKEIQSKLGSIVVQRFEYFVLYFGAPVLWVGAVVLWYLSGGAQGLVNLLNSQVVFGVGRCAYLLGFFESSHSKRLESSCSSVYRFCHSSFDTPIDGVDTGSESLKVFHEDRVKCVDTAPGSVDTSPRFQKTQFPDWDSVSTQPVSVSTLVPSPRRPVLCNWDNVSTHSVTVSTHSG